jgi:hypothetical protein
MHKIDRKKNFCTQKLIQKPPKIKNRQSSLHVLLKSSCSDGRQFALQVDDISILGAEILVG